MAGFVCVIYTSYTYKYRIYYKCNTCIEVDKRDKKRDTEPSRDDSCKLETEIIISAQFFLYTFSLSQFSITNTLIIQSR